MNYGYPPTYDDDALARVIAALVALLPLDSKGNRAYVETDGPYPGVRIRGLTHYGEATLCQLVSDADAAYRRVFFKPK